MSAQAIQKDNYLICPRAEQIQDVLLVSSFGLWAVLLGFLPVLAFGLLMGS
jgi:Na+-transporting NADH:ubiquinone oxidoreductase subunit NqrC